MEIVFNHLQHVIVMKDLYYYTVILQKVIVEYKYVMEMELVFIVNKVNMQVVTVLRNFKANIVSNVLKIISK